MSNAAAAAAAPGTWVLLRGLTRGGAHWAGFDALLAARQPGAGVVALELPGNGALFRARSLTGVEAMTAWCRQRLSELQAPPPHRLLAVSLGGMVAIDWACRAPESLAGAVLVNTSLRGINPWHARLRPSAWPTLLEVALARGDATAREAAVLRLTSRNPTAAAAVLPMWTALCETQPVSGANALRQLIAAARFRAPHEAPRVPLLVLSSRGDRLVDPCCSAAIAARWRAAQAVHPSAGHDLTLDDGPWVAASVTRWLEGNAIESM